MVCAGCLQIRRVESNFPFKKNFHLYFNETFPHLKGQKQLSDFTLKVPLSLHMFKVWLVSTTALITRFCIDEHNVLELSEFAGI